MRNCHWSSQVREEGGGAYIVFLTITTNCSAQTSHQSQNPFESHASDFHHFHVATEVLRAMIEPSLLIKIVPSSHYVAFSNDILEYPSNRVGIHIFSEKRRGERLETKRQGNIPSVTSWDLHSFKTISALGSIGGSGGDLVLHQQKTV